MVYSLPLTHSLAKVRTVRCLLNRMPLVFKIFLLRLLRTNDIGLYFLPQYANELRLGKKTISYMRFQLVLKVNFRFKVPIIKCNASNPKIGKLFPYFCYVIDSVYDKIAGHLILISSESETNVNTY